MYNFNDISLTFVKVVNCVKTAAIPWLQETCRPCIIVLALVVKSMLLGGWGTGRALAISQFHVVLCCYGHQIF